MLFMRGLRDIVEYCTQSATLAVFYSGCFVSNTMENVEKLIFTGG